MEFEIDPFEIDIIIEVDGGKQPDVEMRLGSSCIPRLPNIGEEILLEQGNDIIVGRVDKITFWPQRRRVMVFAKECEYE